MPIYQATLFFSQTPLSQGWVEQFLRVDASLQSAMSAALALANFRLPLCGNGVGIYRVRVTDIQQTRSSQSAQPIGITSHTPAVLPYVCMQIRLRAFAGVNHYRDYPYRGWPQGAFVQAGGRWVAAPDYAGQLGRWLDRLVSDGWCLDVAVPIGPTVPILGIAQCALEGGDIFGGLIDPTMTPLHERWLFYQTNQVPGGEITEARVSGVKVQPNTLANRHRVNGPFLPVDMIQNGFYRQGDLGSITSVSGGKVTFYSQQAAPIQEWQVVKEVVRKCGPAKDLQPVGMFGPGPILPETPDAGPGGVPPVIIPPPGPEPELNRYQTSRDMVIECFKGYTTAPGQPKPKMGIAHASNQDVDTYVVWLAGVDVGGLWQNFGEWWTALASYLSFPDAYTNWVVAHVRENIPKGSRIIWAGHSLGGMTAQWARRKLAYDYPITAWSLVGFGTAVFQSPRGLPIIPIPWQLLNRANLLHHMIGTVLYTPTARFFGYRLDPVIFLSPGGSAAWADIIAAGLTGGQSLVITLTARLVINFWTTLIPEPPDAPFLDLFRLHMSYPQSPQLDSYHWDGQVDNKQLLPPLITGPVKRFVYP